MRNNDALCPVLSEGEIGEIEDIIGYHFSDGKLLTQCFTLSSVSECNNERLEFLGDAVVELCVSELLYRCGARSEGDMTEWRKKLVANDVLRKVVERLGLDKYLLFAGTKNNLGKKPVASLFEALAAGIYLDGGMPAASAFILRNLVEDGGAEQMGADVSLQAGHDRYREKTATVNYIGALQEYLQGRGFPLAEYELLEKSGPDHCPHYVIRAGAQGFTATGEGDSKADARQAAAEKLLNTILKSS